MINKPIYLDCHATTPMDKRVFAAMEPYFCDRFGNPGSPHHYGWETTAAIKQTRSLIADSINASPEEIIFTSGATEANNLAIKGIAEAYMNKGKHIITVATEHSAVLAPCKYLESLGFEITYLPVQTNGLLDLAQLEKAIKPTTILVSVMAANNEIGVIQRLKEIGAICRQQQILFHTDAAQAISKIPLDVSDLKIDLMSLTAHKIYGPKGIGALYVRQQGQKVRLAAQLHGGGQEQGFRSGTLAVPQIIGFAKAIELGMQTMETENQSTLKLRNQLWQSLESLPGIHLNGDFQQRLSGNLNFSIEGVDVSSLLSELVPTVALSSGSACTSAIHKPSHVLQALGRDRQLALSSLRLGIGRFNTKEEIDFVAKQLQAVINSLRQANHWQPMATTNK